MSEYRIFETDEFVRTLARLPADQAQFIQAKLLDPAYPQLRQMPFHGANIRKLRGFSPARARDPERFDVLEFLPGEGRRGCLAGGLSPLHPALPVLRA